MNCSALVLAAALAIGGAGIVPAMAATPTPTPPVADSAGMSPQAAFPRIVANITSDAMTPGSLNQLTSQFAASESAAIGKSLAAAGDNQKLDAALHQFSADWHRKYGNDFSISSDQAALSAPFVSLQMESIRHHAVTVAVKGNGALADIQVPMVYENNAWRIQASTTLTADKLRQNLIGQLSAMDSNSAHWPAHESQAYRQVGARVLTAVLDKPSEAHAQVDKK
jgi:hypothetical protein